MGIVSFVVAVVACCGWLVDAGVPSYKAKPCPAGWKWYAPGDECMRAWPAENWNTSTKVTLTYDEAQTFCATMGAELPIITNRTKLDHMLSVLGPKSGYAAWIGIKDDPANRKPPQAWRTATQHDFTEFFDWDKRRKMPSVEACAAVHALGNPKKRIVGGNGKMITVDCFERLAVVCTKQRVPVMIGGVNNTDSGVIDHVQGTFLRLKFMGRRIPPGTRVTLQTSNEYFFATMPPGQPTRCDPIMPLQGESVSKLLNVSARPFKHRLCNGTCDEGIVDFPANTPWKLGAKYSFCFFLPLPVGLTKPRSPREYGWNLLPNVYLEVIQSNKDHLREVCTRNQHGLELFENGHNDLSRDRVFPYYFTYRHE